LTWTVHRWVWRLEAPLFIGMAPAGALNRCRPYVPARVLWGSVTAEVSRSRSGQSFPDYGGLGREVAENCRFTYLFPGEKRGDKFLSWMPRFEYGRIRGFQWHCEEVNKSLSDRDFRRRLLDARPGTAITPESDSASEGTLRETECLNPWWRDSTAQGEANATLLLGYVFCRSDDLRAHLNNIDTLFVGGDTRYGLGKISRLRHIDSDDVSVFGKQVELDGEHPKIQSEIVWGHALEDRQSPIQGMQGEKELLAGWDQGRPWRGASAWVPGSFLEEAAFWSIDRDGYWVL
jgi:hypothetical protein